MKPGDNQMTPAMILAEAVLKMHGVPDEGGGFATRSAPKGKDRRDNPGRADRQRGCAG